MNNTEIIMAGKNIGLVKAYDESDYAFKQRVLAAMYEHNIPTADNVKACFEIWRANNMPAGVATQLLVWGGLSKWARLKFRVAVWLIRSCKGIERI